MSAEATGWTFHHSPYRGAALAVHLAMADSVNDQNRDEFWMRQAELAAKARTTRQTVNVTLADMVDKGLLEVLMLSAGGANRYRFLMPRIDPVWLPAHRKLSTQATPKGDKRADMGVSAPLTGVSTEPTGVSPGATHNPREPKLIPDSEPNNIAAEFAEWYAIYPKHTARADGLAAFVKARKIVSLEVLMEGARRYRDETKGSDAICNPATWLNAKRWDDEPGANRRGLRSVKGAAAPLERRNLPEGRIYL